MSVRTLFTLLASATLIACTGDEGGSNSSQGPIEQPEESAIFDFAGSCVTIGVDRDETRMRIARQGDAYALEEVESDASARFYMKATDLGSYLFYDSDGGYLVVEDAGLERREELQSDIYLVSDDFISPAEWILEFSTTESFRYRLKSRRAETWLGPEGLVDDESTALGLELEPAEGCTEHPELTLDAEGEVTKTTWDDGDVYGYVDTHSHILSNFGFGGGGIFHGAPFHRLGVAHAMGDCELFHGPEGRADFLGFGSASGGEGLTTDVMLDLLSDGLLPEPAHATDGWPTFSDWPSETSATHQTQYYKWLERAWLSGLRLMVQHMVSNEALCQLMADTEFQPVRWSCEDMLNVDRQIVEVYRMEAYIDAQNGGPGEGWFRIVHSPEEARQVISDGKLAIVLGIEVPNLFDCYLTRRPDGPVCDTDHIEAELDRYHELGIRALFPVHKYDNAFTPGDGDKGIFELGNFIQTGHYSNYVEDCPDISTTFDKGTVEFGGFNEPRDEYLAPPPEPLLTLSPMPLQDLAPYLGRVIEGSLPGDWCQKGRLTQAGRDLIDGIMKRGMILEIDHLPRRSYIDVFEMLVTNDYPAAGTHGNTNDGRLFEIGGISKNGFPECADPADPSSLFARFQEDLDDIEAAGGYAAEGFGWDLNGLAGVRGPRFGPESTCTTPQENPVEYPFTSFAGDVTFTQPQMGERVVDFNNEGFIHVGMAPELIEDARRTGVSDEQLETVFRSAEAYIRMWELSEERGVSLAQ